MRILILAVLVAAASPVLANQALLPAGGNDQVPTRLTALPAPAGTFERKPVSFSWKLDPAQTLSTPAPQRVESREYWQTVEGADLVRGVDVAVSAPGAVIRVSPARGAGHLKPADLKMHRNGQVARLQSAAGDEELQAAGMDVDPGTAVVKLDHATTAGRYKLQASKARGRYLVHVFEPQSDVVLHAQARKNHALSGDTMTVDIAMSRAGRTVEATTQALLVAPDGSSQPVTISRKSSGGGTAQATLPTSASAHVGLWELQVFANDGELARDARTAFAVAQPTAKFKGDYAVNTQLLRLALPVEAGSAGRYEARGTLYATGPDALLRPVSQGHVANWFERGDGILVLDFEESHVPAGFGAPYEVRHLELHDQTRLVPVETRDRGARF
jgi:hypothetical protein